MQIREPLLDAELGLRGVASNAQIWRGTIKGHGAMATLWLNPDGSFQLKEVEIYIYALVDKALLTIGCYEHR